MRRTAIACALLSALLSGGATPAAKTLLASIHPAVLAGLLYCGLGAGAALLRQVTGLPGGRPFVAVPIAPRDLSLLLGVIAVGGTAGPLLLMYGLAHTDASAASLLLTLEGLASALIARFVFHETADFRFASGMACLVAGAVVLSWTGTPSWHAFDGPLAILAACVAWSIDSHLTRKMPLADSLQIVQWKGLVAGPANLGLGLLAGGVVPGMPSALVAGLLGFVGYGMSLALFTAAVGGLGAARAAAYFSAAPFIGAMIAVSTLSEPLTIRLMAASLLMALGVWLYVGRPPAHGPVAGGNGA